jgi:hypothetical protein
MTSIRCPSKRQILRFFEGKISENDKAVILRHVLSCRECLTVFEATAEVHVQGREILRALDGLDLRSPEADARLRKLAVAEIRSVKLARKPHARAKVVRIGLPATAAGLVLLVALFLVPRIRRPGPNGVERKTSPLEIALIEPRGAAFDGPLTFRWTPVPEVVSYRLEIYDRTLEPLYESGPLAADELTPAAGALPDLRKGEIYFWKVVGVLRDNQTIESEFSKFILQK